MTVTVYFMHLNTPYEKSTSLFSSEIIFVNSIGSFDQATCIFRTVPLGSVIYQSKNGEYYKEAFETLKQTIGETIIMTDGSAAE